MAIDAVIERIREEEGGLRLYLAPRVDLHGQDSCKGTESLLLLGPRGEEPSVGDPVWGGADSVVIETVAEYSRKGNRLRQTRWCWKCRRRMHWEDISNTKTGARREVWRCQECGSERPLDGEVHGL